MGRSHNPYGHRRLVMHLVLIQILVPVLFGFVVGTAVTHYKTDLPGEVITTCQR